MKGFRPLGDLTWNYVGIVVEMAISLIICNTANELANGPPIGGAE